MADNGAAGWVHLEKRPHPWRLQLYIKGRNMTARQLVGDMLANKRTFEESAQDWDLPVEVVREALAYVEANRELVALESEIERLMGKRPMVTRGPQTVS